MERPPPSGPPPERHPPLDDLADAVYPELRALAARTLAAERGAVTLQATALVHEAYLRLADQERARYRGREHFLALAAGIMRRILVDHARRRAVRLYGALRLGVEASEAQGDELRGARSSGDGVDLLALDRALERLAQRDARKARVVEMRFFAGLPVAAIASELGLAPRTVHEDWAFARAWLHRELSAERP